MLLLACVCVLLAPEKTLDGVKRGPRGEGKGERKRVEQ